MGLGNFAYSLILFIVSSANDHQIALDLCLPPWKNITEPFRKSNSLLDLRTGIIFDGNGVSKVNKLLDHIYNVSTGLSLCK